MLQDNCSRCRFLWRCSCVGDNMTAHLHSTGIIPLPWFSRVLDPEASPISPEYFGIAHTPPVHSRSPVHSFLHSLWAAQLLGEVPECHKRGRACHGDMDVTPCSWICTLYPGILSIKYMCYPTAGIFWVESCIKHGEVEVMPQERVHSPKCRDFWLGAMHKFVPRLAEAVWCFLGG